MESNAPTTAVVDTALHTPNETPIPVIAPAPSTFEDSRKSGSTGSVIAILLIVVLLVIGAFYVWGQRLSEQRANQAVPAVGQ